MIIIANYCLIYSFVCSSHTCALGIWLRFEASEFKKEIGKTTETISQRYFIRSKTNHHFISVNKWSQRLVIISWRLLCCRKGMKSAIFFMFDQTYCLEISIPLNFYQYWVITIKISSGKYQLDIVWSKIEYRILIHRYDIKPSIKHCKILMKFI